MSTFNLYRFSPHHLRAAIHARLAWSLKQLLDAWPDAEIAPSVVAAEGFFLRLQRGHVDGCDFLLHHRLVTHLLADEYEQARGILEVGAARQPRLRSTVLCYASTELGDDARWYAQALSLNDLPSGSLLLTAPQPDAAERSRGWLEQLEPLLQVGSPQAYAELVAFRPLWLLASVGATSQIGFGGYSSCLAWGTIALNANRGSCPELLIQAIHELAHQLLFALALDVPLVFNDPSALYASPLRPDQRPMDGVMHACFVSARVLEVLAQIQASPAWGGLSATDQARLAKEQQQSRQSVRDALPTIEAFAQLSALGERVVQAARGVVEG